MGDTRDTQRVNVELIDRYRNMSVGSGSAAFYTSSSSGYGSDEDDDHA